MKNTKYTWNLTDLYSSDDDPQIQKDINEIEKKVDSFVKKWKKRKDYLKDPKVLHQALLDQERISPSDTILLKPGVYIYLRKEQEEDNQKVKALYSQLHDKEVELTNKMRFFSHNISKKIPKSLQKTFLEEPLLKDYKYSLEKIFLEAKHVLTEKEEKVISLLAKTSYTNWVHMVSEFVSKSSAKYEGEEKTFEQVLKMSNEKDKKKRDWAGKEVSKMLKKIEDVAEYELNSVLQTHNTISELHKFKEYDSGKHLADDIDSKTVRAMINSVTSNFSLPQRYYKFFASMLGQKNIKYYERAVEIGKDDRRKYPYEESLNIVDKTFKKLDPEFAEIIAKINMDGRFDVFPRKGKSGGAFCFSEDKSVPIYILLNHTDNAQSVLTLAHEAGHAIHANLSQKHQHPNNSGHSLATAEVASTFFEDFTLSEMNQDSDKESYFYVLANKLHDDVSTIFRQVACYNFELEIHNEVKKKGFLNKKEIGEIFRKNMSAYMGDAVKFDDDANLWWIYWSHIRRPFYVYSYASGLLISKALQKKVKENPEFIKEVKKFLSAGNSKSTKDIFLDLGIDITKKEFWENGLKEISVMLDEFEKLGKELGKF